MSKETNWKQKSQKPQNENIGLTNLNTKNNGNFHLLSFGKIPVRGDIGMKNQRWDLLVICLKIWHLCGTKLS